MADMVNDPPHYGEGTYQVINVIEAWELNYRLGNVVKYVARAHRKGKQLEDLKKAAWYLQREIAWLENEEAKPKFARGGIVARSSDQGLTITGCTFGGAKGASTTTIAVYIDIDKDPFKQYAVVAHKDWSIATLASLVAMSSGEWACGSFGISVSREPENKCLNGYQSVEWMLHEFPPDRFNYYLRKTAL